LGTKSLPQITTGRRANKKTIRMKRWGITCSLAY
jgi:hypothetical protein